jgi:hypothetical protein
MNICFLHFVKIELKICSIYERFFNEDENRVIIKLSAGSKPVGTPMLNKKTNLKSWFFCCLLLVLADDG